MDTSLVISLSADFKNIAIPLGPRPKTGALSPEEGKNHRDINLDLKIYEIPSMDIKALSSVLRPLTWSTHPLQSLEALKDRKIMIQYLSA
ncbi:hypothetical protein BDV41DRAFT_356976 [Aspergillus transmontanensis]|uniref:Uncharacterized protein n=1 Tax=Aspergillus transmontanensis TaxID=1034304 RepID=A0A5N6VR33_9EURO|nr:hypothetical protein BDV41DRAFT_356976 [Aspergillus transmontanensis]